MMRRIAAALLAGALLAAPAAAAPSSQGGYPKTLAALTNTLVLVRGAPAYLANVNCGNTNAAVVYLQFFNKAATAGITLGTDAPYYFLALKASDSTSFQAALNLGTGIVVAATTTPTGSTAPGTPVNCSVTFQ